MADGQCGLRVDHLSDVVRVPYGDDRVPLRWWPEGIHLNATAETVKLKGNKTMEEKRYWRAIEK